MDFLVHLGEMYLVLGTLHADIFRYQSDPIFLGSGMHDHFSLNPSLYMTQTLKWVKTGACFWKIAATDEVRQEICLSRRWPNVAFAVLFLDHSRSVAVRGEVLSKSKFSWKKNCATGWECKKMPTGWVHRPVRCLTLLPSMDNAPKLHIGSLKAAIFPLDCHQWEKVQVQSQGIQRLDMEVLFKDKGSSSSPDQ